MTHGTLQTDNRRSEWRLAFVLVAGRYDVLCDPQNAEKARDLLARLAI
jgi:hypothetical protein